MQVSAEQCTQAIKSNSLCSRIIIATDDDDVSLIEKDFHGEADEVTILFITLYSFLSSLIYNNAPYSINCLYVKPGFTKQM